MQTRAFRTSLWAKTGLVLVTMALGSCNMGQRSVGRVVWNSMQDARLQIAQKTPESVASQDFALVNQPMGQGQADEKQADEQQAALLNAQMPVSSEPVVAAKPFRIKASSADLSSRAAATDCMTAAIYFEAASEGSSGQKAVAQVVINRLRHPAFPKTICGVIFAGSDRVTGCQFTFTCDGALNRLPSVGGWKRARYVAEQALNGSVDKTVGLSTHYHTQWVAPYWRSGLTKLAVVGAHIFYRWGGSWGKPEAFIGRYAGVEALPIQLSARLPAYLVSVSQQEQVSLASELPADMVDGMIASPQHATGLPPAINPILAKQTRLRADRQAMGRTLAADESHGTLKVD